MKKGISIWSFASGELAKAFSLAKDAGFDGVEIALAEDGDLSTSLPDNQVSAVGKQAEQAGIELYSVASGLGWSYSLTSNDAIVREKAVNNAKRQLEVASLLGCNTILLLPGHVDVSWQPGTESIHYNDAWQRAQNAIAGLADYAAQLKVSIGIENVWNSFLISPIEMRSFIDEIGSPWVGSYFDVGNTLETVRPEDWIDILDKRIKKVHFKDYRRAAHGLHGFVDLLSGDVNWPAVMSALGRAGYDDWVTAEMLPPYTYYPDTIIYNTSRAMDAILGRS